MTRFMRSAAAKRPKWWIPVYIEDWFAGRRPTIPITALSYPFNAQLEELWASWIEVYPDQRRPPDWPPTRPSEEARREARKYLSHTKPRWYGAGAPPRAVGRK